MDFLNRFNSDGSWTLFLDRDGVINEHLPNDYIKTWDEFKFIPGVLEAIAYFGKVFGQIVVVTNQQGVGKKLMTEEDLTTIHNKMLSEVLDGGGRIDKVYHCPNLVAEKSDCRKPNTGMGLQAQKDFPNIDFKRSIMVGDSITDMEFGKRLGMEIIFVHGGEDKFDDKLTYPAITNLPALASYMRHNVRTG